MASVQRTIEVLLNYIFKWKPDLNIYKVGSLQGILIGTVMSSYSMNKAEKGKRKNAGSPWESNPGPLTSATSALTTELRQPDNHILYVVEMNKCIYGIY